MKELVVVIGGVNVDIKGRMSAFASELSTSHPGVVWRTPGGVGRNIAVNLSFQGCTVEFIGPFGSDDDGRMSKQLLEQTGVHTTWSPILSGHRTGTYLALLQPDGDLVAAISDMSIMDDFTEDYLSAAVQIFRNASVVCVDANVPENTIARALQLAREFGALSVVEPVSVSKARKVQDVLPLIHTITPNREELAAISNRPVSSLTDIASAAETVVASGVTRVIVTLGKDGVLVADQEGSRHVPVSPADVVDATGAGDAFTAGLVYGYHMGWTLDECIRHGQSLAGQIIKTTDSVLGGTVL